MAYTQTERPNIFTSLHKGDVPVVTIDLFNAFWINLVDLKMYTGKLDDQGIVTLVTVDLTSLATIQDAINLSGIHHITDTSYSPPLTAAGGYVRLDNAEDISLVVPKNSVTPFPVNSIITFEQMGVGAITVSGVDEDVTIHALNNGTKSPGQYGLIQLTKVGINTWVLGGAIV